MPPFLTTGFVVHYRASLFTPLEMQTQVSMLEQALYSLSHFAAQFRSLPTCQGIPEVQNKGPDLWFGQLTEGWKSSWYTLGTLWSRQSTCRNLEQETGTEMEKSPKISQFEILVLKLAHSNDTCILGHLEKALSKLQTQKSSKNLTFTWGCSKGSVEV